MEVGGYIFFKRVYIVFRLKIIDPSGRKIMPLSFRSTNHGNIAFGFFNIESDMLLLEKYFFFADRFCGWMIELAQQRDEDYTALECPVFHISDPHDIGDLMGAIHGMQFTGFIGNLYQRFPFPKDPGEFKQSPKGFLTRELVTLEIEKFAKRKEIPIGFSKEGKFHMGSYDFDPDVFGELIRYVWQGGYPRWKDEVRPPYVLQMKSQITMSQNRFFKGVFSS